MPVIQATFVLRSGLLNANSASETSFFVAPDAALVSGLYEREEPFTSMAGCQMCPRSASRARRSALETPGYRESISINFAAQADVLRRASSQRMEIFIAISMLHTWVVSSSDTRNGSISRMLNSTGSPSAQVVKSKKPGRCNSEEADRIITGRHTANA